MRILKLEEGLMSEFNYNRNKTSYQVNISSSDYSRTIVLSYIEGDLIRPSYQVNYLKYTNNILVKLFHYFWFNIKPDTISIINSGITDPFT